MATLDGSITMATQVQWKRIPLFLRAHHISVPSKYQRQDVHIVPLEDGIQDDTNVETSCATTQVALPEEDRPR